MQVMRDILIGNVVIESSIETTVTAYIANKIVKHGQRVSNFQPLF